MAADVPAHGTALLTSGALATARGGTGFATYSAGQLLIGRTNGTLATTTLSG